MNNPQVRMWSKALAARVGKDAKTPEEAIRQTYRIALSREATVDELAEGATFVKQQEASYSGKMDARNLALADFCHVVMCLSEMMYVE